MAKLQEKTLGLAGLLLVACLALDALLRQRTGVPVLAALFPFLLIALAVVILVYARERLARLAEEEEQEQALEEQERPESALFRKEEGEIEPFTMARSRDQFERFVMPAAAPILAVIEFLSAWRLYHALGLPAEAPSQRLLAAAFLAGQAFLLFLFSRYLLGLSRSPGRRLLKGPGIYLGLACLVCVVGGLTCVVAESAYPQADRIATWVLLASLAVLGVENVLSAIADIYRPRRDRRELSTSYESRTGALLTDPATWVRSVAQALDYQFGFSVSETWFYRFLQNALLPLFIFQVVVLYLLSCLVFLGPEEEGILERFGRPLPPEQGGHLQSGAYVKWPWPFEGVRRFPAKRVVRKHVGLARADEEHHDVLLWTVPHHEKTEMFLVASRDVDATGSDEGSVPVNFLSAHIPIEYTITNVYQYAYSYSDPEKVLEQVAYRSTTREAVSRGLFEMVGEGQLEVAHLLRKRIQGEVDRLQLGLRIEFVGLQGVHPPTPVADAFESVVGALEEKETVILQARAYTNQVLPLAAAEAAAVLDTARAYTVRRIELAAAEAYRFEQRLKGYEKSPDVFITDLYLRTLREALRDTRKYIISADPSSEVIQFDFQQKIRPDLFDLGPGFEKGSSQ